MPAAERTLILIKPDGVARGLVGEILARFERKGLKLVALKLVRPSRDLLAAHYAPHAGKPFYDSLLAFMSRGPVAACVLEGPGAIGMARALMGATFGPDAAAGTIRGDFSASKSYNLVHGSDAPESAAREIGLWFAPDDLVAYEAFRDPWLYHPEDLA